MSEAAPTTKLFECKVCHQQVLVEFTINDVIGEDFIRTMLVCDSCQSRRNPRFRQPVKVQASFNLPYKDL